MKNVMTTIALVLVGFSAIAQTGKAPVKKMAVERKYGLAGCGLGSQLMGKDGNQIFAATSNGLSGNQTFAITTGTLNCSNDPKAAMADKIDSFIIANRAAVTTDIARGQGETIASLSQLMGCPQQSESVGQVLQKNFNAIFSSENQAVNNITDSILQSVHDQEELKVSCSLS
jgi:hypothetical protein